MKMPDFLAKAPLAGSAGPQAPPLTRPLKKRTGHLHFGGAGASGERLVAILLMLAPMVVYWPCLQGGYVWDDGSWFGRSFHGWGVCGACSTSG